MLLTKQIRGFHTGGRDKSRWIEDLKCVVGEADYLFLAKDLQRPADVNAAEADRLTDLRLRDRQLNSLAWLDRKATADPDIELQEQVCDPLSANSKPNVGEVVMRAPLSGDNLAVKHDGEPRIGLDHDLQLPPRKGVDARH